MLHCVVNPFRNDIFSDSLKNAWWRPDSGTDSPGAARDGAGGAVGTSGRVHWVPPVPHSGVEGQAGAPEPRKPTSVLRGIAPGPRRAMWPV